MAGDDDRKRPGATPSRDDDPARPKVSRATATSRTRAVAARAGSSAPGASFDVYDPAARKMVNAFEINAGVPGATVGTLDPASRKSSRVKRGGAGASEPPSAGSVGPSSVDLAVRKAAREAALAKGKVRRTTSRASSVGAVSARSDPSELNAADYGGDAMGAWAMMDAFAGGEGQPQEAALPQYNEPPATATTIASTGISQLPTPVDGEQYADEPLMSGEYHPPVEAGTEDVNMETLQAFIAPERKEVVDAGGVAVVMSEQEEEEHELNKYRKRRRYGCILMIVIIIAVVVPSVVLTRGEDQTAPTAMPSSSPSAMPSLAPTSRKFDQFVDLLIPISGADVFLDRSSPQYRAASWAAEDDMIDPELPLGSEQLLQRYYLATFYYALKGEEWSFNDEWLSETQECSWFGLRCNDDGKINQLFFSSRQGNNMIGTLPFEISQLTDIHTIFIQENFLQGTFPTFLTSLDKLDSLIIPGNEFTGAIAPETFVGTTSLTTLLIGKNPSLGGPIPTVLATLPILSDIRMEDSNFTGPVPSELGSMSVLGVLELQNNRLEGEVPAELYTLTNMIRLRLDDNDLIGTIPSLIGQLTRLRELGLNATQFGGDLPAELFTLTTLRRLFLNNAQFTGNLTGFTTTVVTGNVTESVTRSFADLVDMRDLHLNNNTFTGPIPIALNRLFDLQELFLHGNELTGRISQALCRRVRPTGISNLTADCGADPPEVACDCCEPCYV